MQKEEIDQLLEDTKKERAMDIMDVEWNEERLKQAESILKDLAVYSSLSQTNINTLSKKAKDYFNPEYKIVDSWS